jgi:hypothetical protein
MGDGPGQHVRWALLVLEDRKQLVHGHAAETRRRGLPHRLVRVGEELLEQVDEVRGLEGQRALRGHEAQLAGDPALPELLDERVGGALPHQGRGDGEGLLVGRDEAGAPKPVFDRGAMRRTPSEGDGDGDGGRDARGRGEAARRRPGRGEGAALPPPGGRAGSAR